MSRQKDIVKVFNFLIELLKEPETEISVENIKTPNTSAQTYEGNETKTVLGVPTDDILDLIKKVENITKNRPNFDEPYLRKTISPNLRDTEEESKTSVNLKTTVAYNETTGKPSVSIIPEEVPIVYPR